MCGIVGYIGPRQAVPLLLSGLKRLEYRGYDSAGVAILSNGSLGVIRTVGKLSNLEARLAQSALPGSVGLGHTRWATHGRPSEANAHPHQDCTGRLAVVHNGIIENYAPLKAALAANGHRFASETDTEVVAHLIEDKLRGLLSTAARGEATLREAVRLALGEVHGAYALAVLWHDAPGVLVVAKTASPLAIGLGSDETFLASDVPAFLDHTRETVFLDDGEMAVLKAGQAAFCDLSGRSLDKRPLRISWDRRLAEKAGYRHFMLKEIYEQPTTVENTLRGRLLPLGDGVLEREAGLPADLLAGVRAVYLVACGTAHHAAIVGKYLLERFARVPAHVETASEFRYREPIVGPDSLVIAISQSGETADTLAAIRQAKEAGAKVRAVCNTLGSAITRAADFNLYTHCGPECGVASTKAFVGQLVALTALTLHAAAARGAMTEAEGLAWAAELERLPSLITEALKLDARIEELARRFSKAEHFLYIGRTLNYPTALEGALKLKEISYIHAEGYAAGEMKHGPIALIDSDTPVVAIATRSKVFEKVLSNIEEAKARHAQLIALCTEGETRLYGRADHVLELPAVSEFLTPILNVIPLQLLAYRIADLRGCDVDQPRNLAKSVTVE
ncbi:MAG: glutamine--fructose-6-phosphate transaminase (isomerizing) [Elusimicrobia bacterium]|nr:glutamine--fructose-6-phosphate transaminase (isomerizing) [Elusimicrobiota bacterium]